MPGGVPESEVSDVAPQVQPSAQLTPNVSGDNPVAAATEYAGQLALREERFADQAAVVAANNQMTDLDQEKLYHPKTGLLNQNLGQDAPEAATKTLADYEAKRSAIREGLGNDRQKTMFDRTSGEHIRTVQRQVYSYEHQQYQAWDSSNVSATVANSQAQAVATYGLPHDPGQGDPIDHQVEKQVATLKDYGQRAGWSAEETQLKVSQAKSATYAGIIDDMLAKGNTAGAQSLLDTHGMDILPPQRDQAIRALRTTSEGNEAQAEANAGLAPSKDGVRPTRAVFFDWLNQNPKLQGNAKLYDEVARRGDQFFAREDDAKRDDQKAIASDVWKGLAQDPSQDPATIAGPAAWQKLNGETQIALKRAQAQAVKREGPQEGGQDYYDLRSIVGTDAFAKANLMNAAGKVTPQELEKLMDLQAEQAKAGAKAPRISEVTSNNEIVDNALKNLNLDRDESHSDDALQFRRSYDLAVEQYAAANGGKPPGSDEKMTIAKKLSGEVAVRVPRSFQWFGLAGPTTTENQTLFKRPDAEISGAVTRDIPVAPSMTRQDVANSLRTLNNPADPNYDASVKRMLLWKQGLDTDGSYDPVRKQWYQAIRSAQGTGK